MKHTKIIRGRKSKYDPLREHLESVKFSIIAMRFSEIEDVIAASLPPSARAYPEWWANDATLVSTHVQCRAWQGAGYSAFPNLAAEAVTFYKAS
jgi:hypothetical protein